MESRRKRSRGQIVKWICYALLGLLCAVLQTTPGLFQFGAAKPLWLLPLALSVAVFEGEFAGAVFGAVCGLMWDWLAGRTVGMLALELLLLCFAVSAVMQLYFKNSAANFALIASAAALLVLTLDWLFFYYMPGYSGAASRWLQRGCGAVSVVRAAHGGALGACLLPSVRGRAPHPRRI